MTRLRLPLTSNIYHNRTPPAKHPTSLHKQNHLLPNKLLQHQHQQQPKKNPKKTIGTPTQATTGTQTPPTATLCLAIWTKNSKSSPLNPTTMKTLSKKKRRQKRNACVSLDLNGRNVIESKPKRRRSSRRSRRRWKFRNR